MATYDRRYVCVGGGGGVCMTRQKKKGRWGGGGGGYDLTEEGGWGESVRDYMTEEERSIEGYI